MKQILSDIIKQEKKEIDLALSGSGTRLFGHIGGIIALQELGYTAIRVAATSGGAIIAALYCAGVDMQKVKQLFLDFDLRNMRSFRPWLYFSNGGIYSNKKLIPVLDGYLKGITMKDLKIPLTICAHDIEKNKYILINKDTFPDLRASEASAASSSIPIYFGYHHIKDPSTGKILKLVDGGMSKNYPIDILDNQNRKLIGLWIRGKNYDECEEEWGQIRYIKNTISSYAEALSIEHVEDAHWAKTIPIVIEGVRAIDFKLSKEKKQYMIDVGYSAVMNWYKNTHIV